jgi:hypothetical protein
MLLRPFYPVEEKLMAKVDAKQLISLLLNLPTDDDNDLRKNMLQHFNIRELIVLLHGLTKDDSKDDFYNYNTLNKTWQNMWIDVVYALNNFPCVTLVDTYSKVIPKNVSQNMPRNLNSSMDWYELAIDSIEYDFILEYLIDSSVNKIKFQLIEIKTKKFQKIYEVLENHCFALKIQNDDLSVIKDSENFKSKLKILTLTNYEHFETVEKLKYRVLNVIGNEIDVFSISTLIKTNENLKTIYFKGRLKDYIPMNINENIKVYYDLIVFDTIDKSELKSMGNLSRINKLYLNLTLESNVKLDWLKNCYNLRKLYLALNYVTTEKQILSTITGFPNLVNLTLKRCHICMDTNNLIDENGNKLKQLANIMPKLKFLTLIECNVESDFFNKVSGLNIVDIFAINCTIKYSSFVKISRNIRNITIINQDIAKCQDLIILAYKARSSYMLKNSRRFALNINEKLMTVKVPESYDAFIIKLEDPERNIMNKIINIDNLRIPLNSTLNFTIYPNFNDQDFSFLQDIIESFDIMKINIDQFSFTNKFHQILNIENYVNVTIHKYDVIKLQNHLRRVLSKKILSEKDKKFFLPYPCSRHEPSIRLPGTIDKTNIGLTRKMSAAFLLGTKKSGHKSKSRNMGKTSKNAKVKDGILSKSSRFSSSSSSSLSSPATGITPLLSSTTISPSSSISSTATFKLTKSTLINKSINNGELPFECDACEKRFGRSTALNRHKLVHKNYRPFKCELCGYCFKRSDHLKVHQRICLRKHMIKNQNLS